MAMTLAQRRGFNHCGGPLQANSAQPAIRTSDHHQGEPSSSPSTINNLNNNEESSVLYANITDTPPRIVGSQGMYLYTSDGREILDATGGAAVVSIGHNHPRVKQAIMRQLDEVAYSWAPMFTTHAAEMLARELVDSTGGEMSKVFVVSSGKPPPDQIRSDQHSPAAGPFMLHDIFDKDVSPVTPTLLTRFCEKQEPRRSRPH